MKPIAALTIALAAATAFTSVHASVHAQDFPSPDAANSPGPEQMAAPAPGAAANPAVNPDAARSVHLWWDAPPASAFVNEITVDRSVPGSYFMACGFGGGYFGLQELPDKRKVALFSVWDEAGGGSSALRKVEVLASGDGVAVSRFGGEGTGVKTMWPFAWKEGRTYKMLVRAAPDEAAGAGQVIYSAYIAGPDINGWKLMATLRAQGAPKYLQGLYSFAEDFRRDGKSVLQERRARFGSGWVRTPDNEWVALTQARFTADQNTHANINAGITPTPEENKGRPLPPGTPQKFFLATGGLTRQSTKLNSTLEIVPLTLPN